MQNIQAISVRGKQLVVPAIQIEDATVVVKGRLPKVASIHDEVWLESRSLPDPLEVLEKLRSSGKPPDLFTFTQRIPDVKPRYHYHMEWENFAVTRTALYDDWEKTISKDTRKKIKKAAKRGVTTKAVPYDDELVRGIGTIYNESDSRQGKRFWHYGKDFETIKAENGTYLDRSIFIGAFHEGALIGFVKMVLLGTVASTMQVISMIQHFDKAPNNALLAHAVAECSSRGVEYLTYGIYSSRTGANSLSEFKKSNGFFKMDVPRYYVPLTLKGNLFLRSGLHKGLRAKLPSGLVAHLLKLRARLRKKSAPLSQPAS